MGHGIDDDVDVAAQTPVVPSRAVVASLFRESRGDSAFRHYGMGFTEHGLADETDGGSAGGCLNGCPEAGAAGADYENIVLDNREFSHLTES